MGCALGSRRTISAPGALKLGTSLLTTRKGLEEAVAAIAWDAFLSFLRRTTRSAQTCRPFRGHGRRLKPQMGSNISLQVLPAQRRGAHLLSSRSVIVVSQALQALHCRAAQQGLGR